MKIYVMQVRMDDESYEVLPHAHLSPEAAQTSLAFRSGTALEWKEHNSHGHCWEAKDGHYVITEIDVVDKADRRQQESIESATHRL